MLIFPAIDIFEGKAVRLLKGDYNKMTVYNDNPVNVAQSFKEQGATHIHIVDLEGAKTGRTTNIDIVREIKKQTGLFCEIGGGIRDNDTVNEYFKSGIDRVIIGTAAVTKSDFARNIANLYGEKIAIGVDIKDGFIAIKGWVEKSDINVFDFCSEMQSIGIKTIICTDISKDGAMQGTNYDLYRQLKELYNMQIVASGGISTIDDVKRLAELGLYGGIIGKAYYSGAINLHEAIEVAK